MDENKDHLLSPFDSDIIRNEIISYSVDFIFESFYKELDEIQLSSIETKFASLYSLAKINEVVELSKISHDGTDFNDDFLEKFEPDREPYPCSVDSWARGTVNTKKIVVEENVFKGLARSNSGTPSISSFKSSVTGRSRTSGSKSRLGSSHSRRSSNTSLDVTGKIIELDEDPEAQFLNLNATGHMFNMLQKSKKKKSKGSQLKEDEKDEFELLQEQLDKASKDLHGKKFVLDRYGNPVVVGKIKPSKVPLFSSSVGMNLKSDTNNEPDKKNDKKYVRIAGSRSIEHSYFKPVQSLATSLSGLDHIKKVNPGVVFKSDHSVRSGESIPEDPKRISRKKFNATLSRSHISSQDSLTSYSKTFNEFSLEQDKSGSYLSFESSNENKNSNQSKKTDISKSIDDLPDIDSFEGGRKINMEMSEHSLSDEELGLGPLDVSPSKSNTGILPQKPNKRQIENINLLSGSPDNGKPRDRDVPKNMKSISERKHLPAPPIGYVTGHGMNLEKFLENSTLGNGLDDWHQQWRI